MNIQVFFKELQTINEYLDTKGIKNG